MCLNDDHILFICNTYMQLITAIQIKEKLYKNTRADLILSDHSVGASSVGRHLSALGVFERVRTVNTKEICYVQSRLEDSRDVLRLTFNLGNKFKKLLWKEDITYDLMFYYNRDALCLTVFDESSRRGKVPKCVCFEEGIFSYSRMAQKETGRRIHYALKLRRLFDRNIVFGKREQFACFYPEIFPDIMKGKCLRIPFLDRSDVRMLEILNCAFDYRPEDDQYLKKYIFFASSSDIDGNGTGETELVLQLADLVGKSNILVKMHPRDGRHIYEDYGLTVLRNSSVPWEVIQLNHDFSDHIFLTMSSGSVLNASVMLGDEIETRYLYPLVRKRNEQFYHQNEMTIGETLERLKKNGKCGSFEIARGTLEDVLDIC